MLKESQKQDIIRLRSHGWGYRKIACAVNASRDQVRNFCKSNSVAGKGIDLIKKIDNLDEHYCKMCGTALIQNKTGRRKLYCSKDCKTKWEKLHPVLHEIQCQYCGNVVFVQNADTRKFCSHECYIKNRFWRLDDATEIVKLLLEGKRIPYVPKWMKDLILAEDADQKNNKSQTL